MKPLVNAPLIPDHPLSRGLVGYWAMNEGAGLRLNDATRSNNPAIGAVPLWGGNRQGGGTRYNGSSAFWAVSDAPELAFGSGQYSVMVGFRTSSAARRGIVTKITQAGQQGFYIDILATGIIRAGYQTSGAAFRIRDTSAALNDGKFHDFAHIRSATTALPDNYVDGVLNNGSTLSLGTPNSITTTAPLWFGRSDLTGTGYFDDQIAYVALYNRALSAIQVEAFRADPYQMFDRSPASGIWVPSNYNQALTLTAETGVFTVSGQDANLTPALLLDAETGQFTVTGQDADLIVVQGAEDTHDGFWRKKYREMWERKPKLPDLEEIIEAVQESPKAAIEAVPEVKQSYPDIDYTQVRANLQLQTFIAKQILVVLELRRLQDEDDIEALMLLS